MTRAGLKDMLRSGSGGEQSWMDMAVRNDSKQLVRIKDDHCEVAGLLSGASKVAT
jgi:hypothetical protein